MSKAELNELAKTFEIENPTKIKKDDLVAQLVEIQAQRSGLEKANGVLDVLPEGYGFLRRDGYLVGGDDIYISQSQIRRFELRRGDLVAGQVRRPKENEMYYGIVKVETINGYAPEAIANRRVFEELGAEPPTQRFALETRGDLAARAVEGGGSLTVLATLSAGASAFDALLLDEFSPVANAELILARELAEVRAYPPVDLMRSGNWYEEQLLSEIALHKVTDLRRALSGVASVEASERIYAALARTKSNDEFVTALDLKKV